MAHGDPNKVEIKEKIAIKVFNMDQQDSPEHVEQIIEREHVEVVSEEEARARGWKPAEEIEATGRVQLGDA